MTEDIKKEVYEMTDRIATLSRKRQNARNQQKQISDRVSLIRARLVVEIATARDHRGKPTYSNQQLRNAVLTLRLHENQEYQGLAKRLSELDDLDKTLSIELKRLSDRRALRMLDIGWENVPSFGSI